MFMLLSVFSLTSNHTLHVICRDNALLYLFALTT